MTKKELIKLKKSLLNFNCLNCKHIGNTFHKKLFIECKVHGSFSTKDNQLLFCKSYEEDL